MVESTVAVDVSYDVSFEIKKHFTPSELSELQHAFKLYDKDKNGSMNAEEFKQVLVDLGKRDVTDAQVNEMISQVDRNNDKQIQWVEFLDMFKSLKSTNKDLFKQVLTTKAGEVEQTTTEHGGTHSYLVEEKMCFTKLINYILEKDEDVGENLPINPENDDVFHALEDGLILSKLINAAAEGTILWKALNTKKNLNVYQVKENLNLALNACKGIGLRCPGINYQAFIEKKPHLILAVLWQIMRMYLTKSIDLKNCPEIIRLAEEGEELHDLIKLPPETILIRWVNFHLKESGQERRITNLGADLKDSIALTYVLNRLDPAKCSLEGLQEEDLIKRAELVINNSLSIGCPPLVRPSDITTGNVKINTVFLSELFNTKHGLEELTLAEIEKIGMLNDDIEGSRDERAFRFWINSLNLENIYINNLYEECSDGLVLLHVIHKLDNTVVDWKKVDKNPNNKFKKGINCSVAIDACKKLGIKVPGISGNDLLEGNRKQIIAIVWQLVRLHYLQIIGSQSEEDLIKWANQMASEIQVKNFKDKSIADGQYLLKLCSAIEPRAIDWEIVMKGETDEEKENNAKYILSIARKLGAVIFCVWEDITNVNYKMILVLICSLFELFQEKRTKPEE